MISAWITASLLVTIAFVRQAFVIWSRRLLKPAVKQTKIVEDPTANSADPVVDSTEPTILDSLEATKTLYHQLLNLEDDLNIVPVALETLYQALDRAVAVGLTEQQDGNIMALKEPEGIRQWIARRDRRSIQSFEDYVHRREDGGLREIMLDLESAKGWLRAQAPLRYVDGAWLGRLNRVHTPWVHEQVMSQLWQILSEELGDGDPTKHHTNVYHQLMQSILPLMPEGHSIRFLEEEFSGRDHAVWQSGLTQLLIAIFHEELLPEVLGFNLHFEGLTSEMMMAAMETRELGLDPSYFMLHISIDNAVTGHSAMAVDAVCDYIQHTRELNGVDAAAWAWRRVQAGYVLSEGRWNLAELDWPRHSRSEEAVAEILGQKAEASCHIHCTSRTKLTGSDLRLVDWLEPVRMRNGSWRIRLVRALASSRHWITPGDSDHSRFMRELLWSGRMFGAFTDAECRTVESWINHLLPPSRNAYAVFVGKDGLGLNCCRSSGLKSMACARMLEYASTLEYSLKVVRAARAGDGVDLSADGPMRVAGVSARAASLSLPDPYLVDPTALSGSGARWLPALWYGHLGLLEQFIALPSRCGSSLAQAALRVLRAQYGLFPPTHSVSGAGIGQTASFSKVGTQLIAHHNPTSASSFSELLRDEPCGRGFVEIITQISCFPARCQSMLLGMATGFVPMHRAMASSCMFDPSTKALLGHVAKVEDREFSFCFEIIQEEVTERDDFLSGYFFVRQQLLGLID
jgi:hypothetical protein